MRIKSSLKRMIKTFKGIFRYEVKNPIYIPVLSGNILGGKSVLITGGGSGIGYAIASVCLRQGAVVIISGRNEQKLQAAKERLILETECEEQKIAILLLDIEKIDEFKDKIVFAKDVSANGRIDILVNNAGVGLGSAIGSTIEADFDKTLDTNLKGTYFLTQEFVNYLIENEIKGNILNISSVSGNRPAITPYMVSKWGINGLTKGLAKKYIPYGIVVNGIAPGPTTTDMLNLNGTDLSYEGSPSKRYCDPTEVANLACFLMSDMGRMIVGETIYITGGCGTLTVDDINYE